MCSDLCRHLLSAESTKSTTVYARGSYTAGATDISKANFNRLFKEVNALKYSFTHNLKGTLCAIWMFRNSTLGSLNIDVCWIRLVCIRMLFWTNENRPFLQVTASLTIAQKLYVHDGAVGSSPLSDAKVRTISDNPSSALLFRSILEPAPTRQVSHQEFPFTVYIASTYR